MGNGSGEKLDLFISYSSSDGAKVVALADMLAEKGLSVFLDRWRLTPGTPWLDEIETAIAGCRAAIVVLGPGGLGPVQRVEMRACLMRHADAGMPVAAVLLPGTSPSSLPTFLRANTWIDLRTKDASTAVDDFRRLVSATVPPTQPPSPKTVTPSGLVNALRRLEPADICLIAELSGLRRSDLAGSTSAELAVSLKARAEVHGCLARVTATLEQEFPSVLTLTTARA